MFEPVLDHNRGEFKRLRRLQLWTVAMTALAFFGIVGGILLTGTTGWVLVACYSLLGLMGIAIFVLETRRTLVLRRDLKELAANTPEPRQD